MINIENTSGYTVQRLLYWSSKSGDSKNSSYVYIFNYK